MISDASLSDCRHCEGPAELLEPADKVARGAPAEAPRAKAPTQAFEPGAERPARNRPLRG